MQPNDYMKRGFEYYEGAIMGLEQENICLKMEIERLKQWEPKPEVREFYHPIYPDLYGSPISGCEYSSLSTLIAAHSTTHALKVTVTKFPNGYKTRAYEEVSTQQGVKQ